MQRVSLKSGFEVSRLVYGLWRLGDDEDTSARHIQAKIEACLAQGITTLDHADIYNAYSGEALLGTCLKAAPHLRDQVEIITKCGIIAPIGRYQDKRVKYYDTSRDHIFASVEHSLRVMHTDYIDLLLIHRPDPFMEPAVTGVALDELVASGKVRSVGVSNFKPFDWSLLQSAMSTPLVTNQIELSVMAHHALTDGDLAFLQERAIPPMAWSPLGGGALFAADAPPVSEVLQRLARTHDVEPAAVAIAWLLAHPALIIPILGTNKLERIRGFSEACKIEIDRQTWFEIYTAARGEAVA